MANESYPGQPHVRHYSILFIVLLKNKETLGKHIVWLNHAHLLTT